jgi:uncharacterized protein DUF4242
MKKYVIERHIPGIHRMSPEELKGISLVSNNIVARLAPKIQWVQSFISTDKSFCVYLAEDEETLLKHARLSGFPANGINEIGGVIDPTTAGA